MKMQKLPGEIPSIPAKPEIYPYPEPGKPEIPKEDPGITPVEKPEEPLTPEINPEE